MDILQSDGRTEVIHNYFTAFTVIDNQSLI